MMRATCSMAPTRVRVAAVRGSLPKTADVAGGGGDEAKQEADCG